MSVANARDNRPAQDWQRREFRPLGHKTARIAWIRIVTGRGGIAMRKWLIGIVAVIVVIVAVLIVVPLLIPTETYKGQIVERVKAATGRTLALNGPISLSVLPSFALTVSDVVFGNAPGASTKNMATFGKLQLQVQPIALLSGRLVIDSFVLVDPVIALEVDKQGRPNWQFAATTGAPAAVPTG